MAQADGSILIDTEINSDGMKPGTKEVENSVRKMSESVNNLGKNMEQRLQKQVNLFAKVNGQYAQQERKIKALKDQLNELSQQKIETAEYSKLSAQLTELEQQFDAVEQQQREWREIGIPVDSSAYQELEKQLDRIWNQQEMIQNKQQQMRDSGTAYKDPAGNEQYIATSNKLLNEEQKLYDMNNRLGDSYSTLKDKLNPLSDMTERYRKIISGTGSPLRKLKLTFKELKKDMFGLDNAQKKAEKSNKKLNKSLGSTKKNADSARMSLMGMLGRSVLFSTVFRGISVATNSIKEGTQNLARYSDDSNKAMSMLISSLLMLKNSFAVAFSPVLQFVAPVMKQFISLIAEANNGVAQFTAALTGKDTYVKAVAVQEDYAASLKETQQAEKDAAKEAKKTTYAFDTLIQSQKETLDNNKYKGPTPDQMFQTQEVPSEVKGMADSVKDTLGNLFKPIKDSWDEYGPMTINAAKTAFNSLGRLAKDVGASFMQVWTNEGYGKKITDDLLITFANLALTVANLADRFDDAWRKADTGTNIIRHLGDIVLTLTGFLREASAEIRDWSAELDFSPLLQSFDNVLVRLNPVVQQVGGLLLWLLKNVFLPLAKWALESAVPAVLDLIAAGLELLTSVVNALKPLGLWLWENFLKPLGEWAGATFINALKTLKEKLEGISDWINNNQDKFQNMTLIVLSFFAAWKVAEFVGKITRMIGSLGSLISTLGGLDLKFYAIVLVITSIIYLATQVAKAWDKMTPDEKLATKILAVAGALALVAAAIAIQMKDWATAAIAGIIAGMAGMGIAGLSSKANSRTSSSGYSSASAPSVYSSVPYSMPRLATGTVVPPRAGEFAAILGDNKRETEVVSPLSTMKQAVKDAMAEMGGIGGNQEVKADLIVDGTKFGKLVYKYNNSEKQRVGVRMVTEG